MRCPVTVCFGIGLWMAMSSHRAAADPSMTTTRLERDPPLDATPDVTTSPHVAAGVGFDVIGYAAPSAMLGGSAFGEIASGSGSPWRPSARLSLGAATTGSLALGSGAATFTLLVLRLEGCPLAASVARVSLHPCFHFEGGGMAADAEPRGDVVEPYSSRTAWFGTGLDLRLRVRIVSNLVVELEGGATLPLRRRTYIFENPGEVVFATPALGVRASLALALAPP